MELKNKATRFGPREIFNFKLLKTPQMRAFHMSWFAFFLCFFAWFGIAPLMKIVAKEMSLTKSQIGWCIIGSVAITVLARLFIGWLCDRVGPRLAYLATPARFDTGDVHRLCARLYDVPDVPYCDRSHWGFIRDHAIPHLSDVRPELCGDGQCDQRLVGGNLGGGVTQMVMPLVFAGFVTLLGFSESIGWRASMFVAGLMCALTGVAYYLFTQDAPDGNFSELRAQGFAPQKRKAKARLSKRRRTTGCGHCSSSTAPVLVLS